MRALIERVSEDTKTSPRLISCPGLCPCRCRCPCPCLGYCFCCCLLVTMSLSALGSRPFWVYLRWCCEPLASPRIHTSDKKQTDAKQSRDFACRRLYFIFSPYFFHALDAEPSPERSPFGIFFYCSKRTTHIVSFLTIQKHLTSVSLYKYKPTNDLFLFIPNTTFKNPQPHHPPHQ